MQVNSFSTVCFYNFGLCSPLFASTTSGSVLHCLLLQLRSMFSTVCFYNFGLCSPLFASKTSGSVLRSCFHLSTALLLWLGHTRKILRIKSLIWFNPLIQYMYVSTYRKHTYVDAHILTVFGLRVYR